MKSKRQKKYEKKRKQEGIKRNGKQSAEKEVYLFFFPIFIFSLLEKKGNASVEKEIELFYVVEKVF